MKRQGMKFLSAWMITVLLFFTGTESVVYAEEESPHNDVIVEQEEGGEDIEGQDIIPFAISKLSQEAREEWLEYVDSQRTTTEESEKTEFVPEEPVDKRVYDSIYPKKFSLLNVNGKNYVSPVKLQNPWGTCWSFATIAAAETSIMYESDLYVTEENPNPLDLSEKQVAWFAYVPVPDDYENNQGGEGIHCIDKTGNETRDPKVIYNQGGTVLQAEQLFTSAIGPLAEKYLPYGPTGITPDNYMNYANIREDGVAMGWSDEVDWSVPDEERMYYSYLLEESKNLPSAADNNQEGVLAMKSELLSGRPVWIAYFAEHYLPSQDSNTAEGKYIYLNEAGQCSHYTYQEVEANHAVTVVGYDDNYSRDNFVAGHRPPGNGAWLVKNSWGAEKASFPNQRPEGWGNGGDGYFWLSYYDKSIMMEQTLNFDLSEETLAEESRFVYEYDLMPSDLVTNLMVESPISYANVFTAEERGELNEVGVSTQEGNSQVAVSIYLLDKNAKDPTDDVLLETLQKTYPYSGYHKIPLTQSHILKENQKFAVVVTEVKDGNYCIPLHYEINKNMTEAINSYAGEILMQRYAVGIVNPGESYVYADGTWGDLSDAIQKGNAWFMEETDLPEDVLAIDNFTIKAYGHEIK